MERSRSSDGIVRRHCGGSTVPLTGWLIIASLMPRPATAQAAMSGDSIRIARATGPITVDGDLSEDAWRDATRVDKWYETTPGDNVEPKVRSTGYLTYDDRFLYAAFEFDDPNPAALRAPFSERDNIDGNTTDYGGLLLDARGTGSTAVFFLVTPRNIQYDSVVDDASSENSSPDFFWDSATRMTARGWTLEMRIPFSSLRYRHIDPQTWHVMLYRNYPRDFRYQLASARLPRDSNCFVCHANLLVGLEKLPGGGHIVAAPYMTAADTAEAAAGAGTPLGPGAAEAHIGGDIKVLPNANDALDLTIKPDFSQVESDTAQISTNQRFALFYPEKRPFFLEGVDLFATPMQAVYTRTITAPVAGGRATGKELGIRYTVLVADDTGGGEAILPGPTSSSVAPVDFGSTVLIARAKHDMGLSFLSALATDRENHDGQGYNRVAGPDFLWRPSAKDSISGQTLFSNTVTPNAPAIAEQWAGQTLTGHASQVQWNHGTTHVDWLAQYRDATSGFRADVGFMPQVDFRDVNGFVGWTVRPTHAPVSNIRSYVTLDRQLNIAGDIIYTDVEPGVGMNTAMSGFVRVDLPDNQVRTTAGDLIHQRQFAYYAQVSPSNVLASLEADGTIGQAIDFDNSRPGHGTTLDFSAEIRPTNHLDLAVIANAQWLNVADTLGASQRLFIAHVSRLKSTYTFTSRLFVRAIEQYVSTARNPLLYRGPVDARSGDFSGSLLVAYKLNWQSVMYVGYGDDRELTQPAAIASTGGPSPPRQLAPIDRQAFVKVSYAFQR
jgi:hypothetical protein